MKKLLSLLSLVVILTATLAATNAQAGLACTRAEWLYRNDNYKKVFIPLAAGTFVWTLFTGVNIYGVGAFLVLFDENDQLNINDVESKLIQTLPELETDVVEMIANDLVEPFNALTQEQRVETAMVSLSKEQINGYAYMIGADSELEAKMHTVLGLPQ